jgi:hypothetical protein
VRISSSAWRKTAILLESSVLWKGELASSRRLGAFPRPSGRWTTRRNTPKSMESRACKTLSSLRLGPLARSVR